MPTTRCQLRGRALQSPGSRFALIEAQWTMSPVARRSCVLVCRHTFAVFDKLGLGWLFSLDVGGDLIRGAVSRGDAMSTSATSHRSGRARRIDWHSATVVRALLTACIGGAKAPGTHQDGFDGAHTAAARSRTKVISALTLKDVSQQKNRFAAGVMNTGTVPS